MNELVIPENLQKLINWFHKNTSKNRGYRIYQISPLSRLTIDYLNPVQKWKQVHGTEEISNIIWRFEFFKNIIVFGFINGDYGYFDWREYAGNKDISIPIKITFDDLLEKISKEDPRDYP